MNDKEGTTIEINTSPKPEKEEGGTITAVEEHAPSQPMTVSGDESSAVDGGEDKADTDPLEAAQKETRENRERWMRAVAELENYKKRIAQERTRMQKYRYEALLRDLLPIVDNMDRAVHHCSETGESDGVAEGLCMIAGMFRDLLQKYGVKEIESLGEPFDPQYHEAIARLPSTDKPANVVVEEMEKGYLYQDRLLRPAKVVVASGQDQ
ncbi:MAG: nucleotide exchange factor GrpE [Desulfomonilaceae bacterium]|nr:nucleotide exchange factor GrpE [Desulfomonilaceae bacterium]